MLTAIHLHYLSNVDKTNKIFKYAAKLKNGVAKKSFIQLLQRKEAD